MTSSQMGERFATVFLKLFESGYMDDLADLFQGECKVLFYLCTAGEETVYPSDISRDLQLTRQRVTSVLGTMEKKGYVLLERDLDDKRRVRVKISCEGERIIEEKQQRIKKYFKLFMEKMGEENILNLLNGTEKALDALIELDREEKSNEHLS